MLITGPINIARKHAPWNKKYLRDRATGHVRVLLSFFSFSLTFTLNPITCFFSLTIPWLYYDILFSPSLLTLSLSLSFLVIPHFSSRSLQFSTRILSILTRYLFSLDSFTFILRFLIFSSVSSLSYRFLSFLFAFSSPTFPYASSFSLFFLFFFLSYTCFSSSPNISSFFRYAHFLSVSLSVKILSLSLS